MYVGVSEPEIKKNMNSRFQFQKLIQCTQNLIPKLKHFGVKPKLLLKLLISNRFSGMGD